MRPSVCPHASARLALDGFSRNVILGTFTKICRGTQNLFKIGKQCGALCTETSIGLHWRQQYEIFCCSTIVRKESIFAYPLKYSMILYRWHLRVDQQYYTGKVLLPLPCYKGYSNALQYYVTRTSAYVVKTQFSCASSCKVSIQANAQNLVYCGCINCTFEINNVDKSVWGIAAGLLWEKIGSSATVAITLCNIRVPQLPRVRSVLR